MNATTRPAPHGVALYLGVVQFFFALTWTVYVIYLPALAEQAGIGKGAVLWILMLDQAIFAVCDAGVGAFADRAARVHGRLARMVLALTVISCLAFLLLPYLAGQGSPALLLAAIVVWSATSSALRAPPLALLGKHAATPSHPWLAALVLLGLGIAAAVSPYLALKLRGVDPRLPFALSSLALVMATLGILAAERRLAPQAAAAPPATARPDARTVAFLAGVLLLGLGQQIHFAVNSAPQYLRVASQAELPWLMPAFWVGFNVLMLPAAALTKRFGGVAVMTVAGVLGAIALALASRATSLDALVAAQLFAGGMWGCVLMSATAAALGIGHTGREGTVLGGLFAALAVAAFARMAVVAGGMPQQAGLASVMAWAPVGAWIVAALLLAAAAGRGRAAAAR
jgi:MFS family permease